MEQTISMGMAMAITGCVLLLAAVGPTLSQVIESKVRFESRHLHRANGGRWAMAVTSMAARKSAHGL